MHEQDHPPRLHERHAGAEPVTAVPDKRKNQAADLSRGERRCLVFGFSQNRCVEIPPLTRQDVCCPTSVFRLPLGGKLSPKVTDEGATLYPTQREKNIVTLSKRSCTAGSPATLGTRSPPHPTRLAPAHLPPKGKAMGTCCAVRHRKRWGRVRRSAASDTTPPRRARRTTPPH